MISVKELSKKYVSDSFALENVSFELSEGEICSYIGANGAGKSTTIKILAGITSFESGNVSVCGLNVAGDSNGVKRKIGYVPESGHVFQSLNPFEYLEFISRVHAIEKKVYVKRIFDFLEFFELKQEIKTPMSAFSKGMRQKVLLIASLIHNPDVFLWDEPLNGLDYQSTVLLKDLMLELSKNGKTFFYTTHNVDAFDNSATRVIVLNHGTIVHNSLKQEGQNINELLANLIDVSENKTKIETLKNSL